MSAHTHVIATCAVRDLDLIDAVSDTLARVSLKRRSSISFDMVRGSASFCSDLSGQQVRDALAKVKWSEPAAVRLLIQEQGDAAFSVWRILPSILQRETPWECVLSVPCKCA